ncbi:hypothetical protein A3J15_03855 [Candidatus Roizmanbacteria bacterium RIFCSPLOWO2_02_FULL_38_10]|uniref:Uncharacterized protein n=1 Tax=Candidatus Roizmanbacteria bacterium RIFCSPLOWO2_02_FULL_38_10 TaxID=1802074 RepID=A0A1F7JJL8_9BACT|nr:MAG: hypothetical protein A3J15_03855 [Candidatus Roizmanbacteria bacterium RIFCSPLOWO2_02_FULL_38_10]
MKKIILLFLIILLGSFFSIARAQEHETVCFCHNVLHNPVTICTDDDGLIQGHTAHVQNGSDILGECPVFQPTITINPTIVIPTTVILPTEAVEPTKVPTQRVSPTNKPTNIPKPTKTLCQCGRLNFGCNPVCTFCPKFPNPMGCNGKFQSCTRF